MNTHSTSPVSNFFEAKTFERSRRSSHYLQNLPITDLSGSNPISQYSVSQHGLTSDNTFTNLLVCESQHLPITKKESRELRAKSSQIQEKSDEEQPSYYHDNTQDNKYPSSDEESQDLLFNFILKMVGALAYRTRIVQRNVFEQIYIYASRRVVQDQPIAMELSESSNSRSDQKESLITFSKNKDYDSPFTSFNPNTYNFNSNLKRKPLSPKSCSCQIAEQIPLIPSIKTCRILTCLNESGLKHHQRKQQFYKPQKPMIKFLPDHIKEESIDSLGFNENIDQIFFQNSNDVSEEIFDYFNLKNGFTVRHSGSTDQEEVKNSFENRNYSKENHIHHIPLYEKNIHNQQSPRPLSFFKQPQNVVHQRPVSYFQYPQPQHRQQIYSPKKQQFNDYGKRLASTPKTQSVHTFRPMSPMTPANHAQHMAEPLKVINISYKNGRQNTLPRCHSQLLKEGRPIYHNSPQKHVNIVQSPMKPHSPPPNLQAIRSQYYNTKNFPQVILQNKNTQMTPVKRLKSAPSSPFPQKFMSEHHNQRTQYVQENPVQQIKPNIMVNNFELPNREVSPRPQQRKCQKMKLQNKMNEYYEFTRPVLKKEENGLSNKLGKTKKLNIVSSRPQQNSNKK